MTSSNIRSLTSFIENKYFRNIIIFLVLILISYNLLNIEKFTSNPYQYAQNVIDEFTTQEATENAKNETLFRIDNIISNNSKKTNNSNNSNNSNNLNNNNGKKLKLTLYYKLSCPYCRDFMEPNATSVWTHIKTKTAKYVDINEIDCDKDAELCSKVEGLNNVPTLFLENPITGHREVIKGPRTSENVLKHIHSQLNNTNIEKFAGSANSANSANSSNSGTSTSTTKKTLTIAEKTCPPISFNKRADVDKEKLYYQIFSDRGQYGYAVGGKNEPLSPFGAAYETVDAYLSGLPNPTPDNMKLCANVYKDAIADFGLCNNTELNKILKYNGQKAQVSGTDYSTNTNVVSAIKSACKI